MGTQSKSPLNLCTVVLLAGLSLACLYPHANDFGELVIIGPVGSTARVTKKKRHQNGKLVLRTALRYIDPCEVDGGAREGPGHDQYSSGARNPP